MQGTAAQIDPIQGSVNHIGFGEIGGLNGQLLEGTLGKISISQITVLHHTLLPFGLIKGGVGQVAIVKSNGLKLRQAEIIGFPGTVQKSGKEKLVFQEKTALKGTLREQAVYESSLGKVAGDKLTVGEGDIVELMQRKVGGIENRALADLLLPFHPHRLLFRVVLSGQSQGFPSFTVRVIFRRLACWKLSAGKALLCSTHSISR
jgi:hypothetical protein